MSYYRAGSAGSRLDPEDVDSSLMRGAAVLHLSGITAALSSSAAAAVLRAIEVARAAGVTISFDLNYRANLWTAEEAACSYQDIIPLVDVVFGGEEEAALAVGPAADPIELAQRLTKLCPSQVIIKLGSEGAVAFIDGQVHHQPAVPIDDTVGAGDAFVAGYFAELMNGKAPPERLELAVKTGAFACLSFGDWEGLPTRAELALLNRTESVTR